MGAVTARMGRALTGASARVANTTALHETFLVSAVATVLVIRTQLWLTNYPQLGGAGLHIAHLLWGGVFMVVAIALLLTFAGRPVRRPAAVVGGVGFGFFIDELGKFITADNDYFFEPAAALIYLIFVGLFLLIRRWARRHSTLTAPEEVVNALEIVGDAMRRPLDARERREALDRLARAEPEVPLAADLRAVVLRLDAVPPPPTPGYLRVAAAVRRGWARAAADRRLGVVLAAVFGLWALLSVLGVAALVLSLGLELGGAHSEFVSDELSDLSFVNVASLVSSAVSAGFVAAGLRLLWRGDRSAAYARFEAALLVAIFVTQTFSFVESQFGAVFGAGIAIALLATVRKLAGAEGQA